MKDESVRVAVGGLVVIFGIPTLLSVVSSPPELSLVSPFAWWCALLVAAAVFAFGPAFGDVSESSGTMGGDEDGRGVDRGGPRRAS